MTTVMIVDDQALVRAGFRMICESDPAMSVAAEAGDGDEAVALAATLRPDVVLMDIRMPRMDGVEATRAITSGDGAPKVIMLTTFDLDEYVVEALRAGASGFLLKDVRPEDLLEAIRVVARGDALLAPSVTRTLLDRFAAGPPGPDAAAVALLGTLTERESEVLRHVARGLSNAEIARELFLGETTVKSHVSSVLMKLGVRDRVQAVVFAYESGIARAGNH